MKRFIIKQNKYLDRDIEAFYNCDYVGYKKKGNPDFINHLKNLLVKLLFNCRNYLRHKHLFDKNTTLRIDCDLEAISSRKII